MKSRLSDSLQKAWIVTTAILDME